MCGRFALIAEKDDIEALLALLDLEGFPPRYNIAPTQPILLVIAGPRRDRGSNLPSRRALLVRWGLIPGWAKDPAKLGPLFNARSDTAADKASFKAAMRHRRALIPASGFYEWRRDGSNRPQAYWVRPRHRKPIAFAGLMETWAEPGGCEIDTGAILTTHANAAISHIHDRMPVVIDPQDFSRWLDCVNHEPRDVADLLMPADPDFFEAIPVSDKVNKAENTGPELHDPVAVAEPEQAAKGSEQLTLF